MKATIDVAAKTAERSLNSLLKSLYDAEERDIDGDRTSRVHLKRADKIVREAYSINNGSPQGDVREAICVNCKMKHKMSMNSIFGDCDTCETQRSVWPVEYGEEYVAVTSLLASIRAKLKGSRAEVSQRMAELSEIAASAERAVKRTIKNLNI